MEARGLQMHEQRMEKSHLSDFTASAAQTLSDRRSSEYYSNSVGEDYIRSILRIVNES